MIHKSYGLFPSGIIHIVGIVHMGLWLMNVNDSCGFQIIPTESAFSSTLKVEVTVAFFVSATPSGVGDPM